MKKWLIFALALGATCALILRQRRIDDAPEHQPDLDQWEGEGGAVPDVTTGRPL